MLELNKKARETKMFEEGSITKLIGKRISNGQKLTKEQIAIETEKRLRRLVKEEASTDDKENIADFLTKQRDVKVGFSGRSGTYHGDNPLIKVQPIANTGIKTKVSENGTLFKKFEHNKELKSAIKGFFIPPETENLYMI